jgi:ribosomal protein L5
MASLTALQPCAIKAKSNRARKFDLRRRRRVGTFAVQLAKYSEPR